MNKPLLIAVFAMLFGYLSSSSQIHAAPQSDWLLNLSSSDVGSVRTVMHFEFGDSTFSAHSRRKAVKTVLGPATALMGRIFTSGFKHGALLHIVKGRHHSRQDSTFLSGIFTSAMGSYYFKGWIAGNRLYAELRNRAQEIRGRIYGRTTIPEMPLEDYPAIFEEATELVKGKIYDPAIPEGKAWRKFQKKMRRVSGKVQDDLEMVFAFFYYAGKLPFSHFALMKIPEEEAATPEEKPEPQVFLENKRPSVAYMRILSFSGSAEEMDSIMDLVKSQNPAHLIVDLRNNSGGSVAAGLTFARNITDTAFYGGIFLTQKWFATHDAPPPVSEYDRFPLFSEANFDLILEGIHHEEGLCLKVEPAESSYQGKVYILTNRNTASTCEPIVYGFRQSGRATIIGEKTAGSMLNGEVFALQSGFSLIVPTATYYSSDGFKIDGVGVSPHIETSPDGALDYVLENLIRD